MQDKQTIFDDKERIDRVFNKLEFGLMDDENVICFNGNFSAPNPIKFNTRSEALAFVDGLLFMRNYIKSI